MADLRPVGGLVLLHGVVAVMLRPHHAERVQLFEQRVDRAVVFVFAKRLEYAESLVATKPAHFLQAYGKPAQDGVVQLDRAWVVAEHTGDRLPVLLE